MKLLNIGRMICMEINYIQIIATVINFAILFAIIIAIYKSIKCFKNFINKNKEMDKKIDIILNELEKNKDKEDN
jgi:hypothetical protein